jgi:hypothetical protein
VGVAYAVTLVIGIGATGFHDPIRGPMLVAMELLTLLSAPLLVLLMAAVHGSAPPGFKVYSAAALAFATLVTGLTAAVHFLGLTALRQLGTQGIQWPSPLYALELLAWDVFLGLSLLLAAPIFRARDRAVTTSLLVTGGLCLLGTLGPATGDMRFQFIAVVGYGALLPVTSYFLAAHFRRLPE